MKKSKNHQLYEIDFKSYHESETLFIPLNQEIDPKILKSLGKSYQD